MKFPNRETVGKVRSEFPKGTRVELVRMEDPQAPPIGTKGTVLDVDDTASLIMKWDNGCGLNVLYGVDCVKKLDSVTTICYGKKEIWDSRKEAAEYFMQAMAGSEGSEHERYSNIYIGLVSGKKVCSDE